MEQLITQPVLAAANRNQFRGLSRFLYARLRRFELGFWLGLDCHHNMFLFSFEFRLCFSHFNWWLRL